MKRTQKKLGNKGFSLVELIVVIAIMAVLVGVLAPVLIRNIDKSREGTDIKAVEEVRSCVVTALATETINTEVIGLIASGDSSVDITITSTDASATGAKLTADKTVTALLKELNATIPSGFKFTSNALNGQTGIIITVNKNGTVIAKPTGNKTSNFENGSFEIK